MEIYISRDGQQFGPYTLEDLEANLMSGSIVKTDLAWYEGAPGWIPVSQLPGLYRSSPAPFPTAQTAQWSAYTPQPPKKSSGLELVLLIVLTLIIPLAGLIIGIMRLSQKERRTDGAILLGVSLLLMFLYVGAIALPNFTKARKTAQMNECISNLRQIDGAVQQWALDNKKPDDAPVTFSDISPYLKTMLRCPAGGTSFDNSYSLTTVAQRPTCQRVPHLHRLEPDIAQAESQPPPTPPPATRSPSPIWTPPQILDDSYRARRSYQAEIAEVLSEKAVNDVTAKSAIQQFANGSYRLADMLAIIAKQLDTKDNYATVIQSILSQKALNDISANDAVQQGANGTYRCVELLAIIAQETDRKGAYTAVIKSTLSQMSTSDISTKSAYQQIENGTFRMAEMLAIACRAADRKNRFGTEISSTLSGLNTSGTSSRTAMQGSVRGLYTSAQLMAMYATFMDRRGIYSQSISSQLKQLDIDDTASETVYQQMALGCYRVTDLAGYAAKALNP